MATEQITVEAAGRPVRLTSPDKVLFPTQGWTKLDVVSHYLMCAPGAVRGVHRRPCSLKRWPEGVDHPPFFTKRAPASIRETAAVRFPSARPGKMAVVNDVSDIVDQVQLGCIDLNPWTSRAEDLDHPDELRLDLDPTDGFGFDDCREVAAGCRDLLAEQGLVGWPKTSGSRGIHIHVRLHPRWTFHEARRAALAFAREMERRLPGLATTAWWKEERRGVFIDLNQNLRDKTVAAAYSLRHTGRVSTPFAWEELAAIDPMEMTLEGFRQRWAVVGDLTEGIDQAAGGATPGAAVEAAGNRGPSGREVSRPAARSPLPLKSDPPSAPRRPGETAGVVAGRRPADGSLRRPAHRRIQRSPHRRFHHRTSDHGRCHLSLIHHFAQHRFCSDHRRPRAGDNPPAHWRPDRAHHHRLRQLRVRPAPRRRLGIRCAGRGAWAQDPLRHRR